MMVHLRVQGALGQSLLERIQQAALFEGCTGCASCQKLVEKIIWIAGSLILAQSIGATSYVVVIVSATLANFDRRLEQAAMSMGAGPVQTFRRVTLPLILPGILGGAVFAFIHSFDEVVITSLVRGYSIKTLPLKMRENISHSIDPTIAAVSSLLMLLPVLWVVAIYFTWWRSMKEKTSSHAAI
ncbi:ABC transporter permease subunit [Mesorhizobium sp. M2D.F.Ca.ET.185.01.1.1]|nr:ABC transporter permease subunit [Mesorhizobium sp. M1B.F.Ca.ET.045.04.1.1]RUW41433.1 ABC transporter permease subunit [Mesorhizobium sp. M2A.F.Ca.ET.015.02.1.1]RUW56344.1 ABC transporter permease subunit [Mesorhizobium sp. M8A.F.Ca.ET.021.01.1.1]RVC97270.1 ABC transporter permease subunit [Mesorhizobium sp. M2A.F.Ca.ET.017.03.2.1]RVD11495.1 ABC transporter permease subunit [Mesorhizobium sp. M2A.F.Ca.ET.029.05.1.1]RVD39675.1 ABC transporter permease subunit [Mesorhizobium sp. M4B.F.Ca.ET.0